MIYYLAMADNLRPLANYLKHWAPWLHNRIRIVAYEGVPPVSTLPAAVYIFTDIERLTDALRPRVLELWDELAKRGGRVKLLNDPRKVLCRYELLRALHAAGINGFNAYRPEDPRQEIRFPAFVRSRTEHKGAYSPLMHSEAELQAALAETAALHPSEELLIVEYVESGKDGVYSKYSATRVGSRVLAHHVLFRDVWQVKSTTLGSPELIAADRTYRETNPHEAQLWQIYEMAHIDFGRIDYAMVDGRLTVWEINTNPTPLYRPNRFGLPEQIAIRRRFSRRLNRAFVAIDDWPRRKHDAGFYLRRWRDWLRP